MVAMIVGCGFGVLLGWFSYRHQAWFIDICLGTGALVAAAMVRLAAGMAKAVHVAMAAAGPMNSPNFDDTLGPAPALETLPIWTRISLAIPGTALDFAVGFLVTAFLARIFCHIKARCYTDEPAPLTREQMRAKLWAEMNYSDELLD